MRYLLIFPGMLLCCCLTAQQPVDSFAREIALHRLRYKQEFITEPRSPLTAQDTAFLDFYPADPAWRIPARVTLTNDAEPFELPTYSGKTRLHRQYARLEFEIDGRQRVLLLYQNLNLIARDSSYKDYLFLPFKDGSNGESTYGGGRYLDFRIGDIQNGVLTLDFNKCYNPYCAYSDGYNCPIPPRENHLGMEVRAGEKVFRGEKKH